MIFLMCCWIWFVITFSWGFLHQCSVAYSSPFWMCLCLILGWV
jgi:hypothetical protein